MTATKVAPRSCPMEFTKSDSISQWIKERFVELQGFTKLPGQVVKP